MSARTLAALVSGFGTGYFAAEKQKEDKARQDKIDQREQIRFDNEQADRAKLQKFEDGYAAAGNTEQDQPTITNGVPTASSVDPTQPQLVTTAPQLPQADQSSLPTESNAASQGITKELTKKPNLPIYKVMEEKARYAINNGNTSQIADGYKLLQQSQEIKSKDYKNQVLEARKKGINGLLDLINNHPNDELPYENLKVETAPDGKTAYINGYNNETKQDFTEPFDLRLGSVEDQLTQKLMSQASPENLLNHIQNTIKNQQELRKEDKDNKVSDLQLTKLQQDIDEGKIKLANLPEETKLKLKELKASINAKDASANKDNAEANKAKNGGGADDKKPTSVKEAEWYQTATPAQREAFDKLNAKSNDGLKVTTDQQNGGYLIVSGKRAFKIDDKGVTSEYDLPFDEKGKANSPEYQEYLNAYKKAKGNPEVQKKITERARKNGIVQ